MQKIDEILVKIDDLLPSYFLVADVENKDASLKLVKQIIKRLKEVEDSLFAAGAEFHIDVSTTDTDGTMRGFVVPRLLSIRVRKGPTVLFKKMLNSGEYIYLTDEEIGQIEQLITSSNVIVYEDGYSEAYEDIEQKKKMSKTEAIEYLRDTFLQPEPVAPRPNFSLKD